MTAVLIRASKGSSASRSKSVIPAGLEHQGLEFLENGGLGAGLVVDLIARFTPEDQSCIDKVLQFSLNCSPPHVHGTCYFSFFIQTVQVIIATVKIQEERFRIDRFQYPAVVRYSISIALSIDEYFLLIMKTTLHF
jgi:hypothetical protein